MKNNLPSIKTQVLTINTPAFKILILMLICFACVLEPIFSQNNTFPQSGPVGVGTDQPTEQLDIDGNIKVRNLQGTGDRYVIVDPSGKLKEGPTPVNPVNPGNQGGANGLLSNLWNINGNNGINSSNFLGAINNAPLIFKTNNIQRMVLTAEGKLKVGNSIFLDGETGLGYDEIASTKGKLTFGTASTFGPSLNDYTVDYNNHIYVGIGTNNPHKPLHVRTVHGNVSLIGSHYGIRLEDVLYGEHFLVQRTTH